MQKKEINNITVTYEDYNATMKIYQYIQSEWQKGIESIDAKIHQEWNGANNFNSIRKLGNSIWTKSASERTERFTPKTSQKLKHQFLEKDKPKLYAIPKRKAGQSSAFLLNKDTCTELKTKEKPC